MKYKLIPRSNPNDPQAAKKLYASPVNDGKISQEEIAEEIVALSSLSRGDVANVIDSTIDTIPKYLLMGKSVSLGDLGTFRVSFSSKGVNNANEFNVAMISGIRIIFTPSVKLKKLIEGIHFEKA
ncbi:MAG: HU family DNA-binding protein [Dysgonamonadaceae bacterium]|jgi:predicted histone-like DNA-binding protein|nr:HU family DNA-binding protein [Dysgonamonadaceae bacterium]